MKHLNVRKKDYNLVYALIRDELNLAKALLKDSKPSKVTHQGKRLVQLGSLCNSCNKLRYKTIGTNYALFVKSQKEYIHQLEWLLEQTRKW